MKKITLFALSCLLVGSIFSQDTLQTVKKKKTEIKIPEQRANDHLMLQIGYAGWSGATDDMNIGGFSKSINGYFMFDFPFKTNPKLSMAFGPGIGSDQIKFKETYIGIKDNVPTLVFTDVSDTTHFKKTKLNTTYAELPIEFRYVAHPAQSDKSFKFAIGVKIGTMLEAHTRNVTLEDKNDNTLNDYKMKEISKKFFNTTRICGTARVGFGHFTAFGTYQTTNLFKEGVAPVIHPYSVGLTLSGL